MKSLKMLVWLTQLGLSICFPLAGFILLAAWLRDAFSLGTWVMVVGIIFGIVGAVDSFCASLKAMNRIAKGKEENPSAPQMSFNEHQ